MKNIEKRKLIPVLLIAVILTTAVSGLILSRIASAEETNTAITTTTQEPIWRGREGFGIGRGGKGCGAGPIRNLEVSPGYTQKVKDILNSDADVKNLLDQGYNITRITPIIKNTVEADGAVTSKATAAVVILEKTGTGHARVDVDVTIAKVTRIEIVTRTVIDKSS